MGVKSMLSWCGAAELIVVGTLGGALKEDAHKKVVF